MSGKGASPIPGLLSRLREGDDSALDELFPLLYGELHRLAKLQRAAWSGNETLNTTALLHEAYVKLSRQHSLDFGDRSHFLRAASRAMRHVLVNYTEGRGARKRGGGVQRVDLEKVEGLVTGHGNDPASDLDAILTLDGALKRLEKIRARQVRIVECRIFGGMTIDETAQALDVSPATVSRGWSMARAWLHRELGEGWP